MTTHRRRASTSHERYRRTSCQVDAARERPRLDEAQSSPVARTTSNTIRCASPFRVKSLHDESRAEHLPWRSNDVRTSCEVDSMRPRGARSPVVARRSVSVVKGRRGKRSRDGTPREAVDHGTAASRARMRRAQRAPRPSLVWGERVPSIEPFSPPPLDPPSPVARSRTNPRSPRPLHPRPRRPLQFQAAARQRFGASAFPFSVAPSAESVNAHPVSTGPCFVVAPSGQRTSIASTVVAPPVPKWSARSLREP